MDAGSLIFLLLIVGGVFAMFAMHRGGGHAHGGKGGGCCGGHGHDRGSPDDQSSTDEPREEKPLLGKPGSQGHDHEAATASGKRRGC